MLHITYYVSRNKIVSSEFPHLKIGDTFIQFVDSFKYLGHHIVSDLSDDTDILREIRNMFLCTNILLRRFSNCSVNVKVKLFRSYCLGLYDIALWDVYKMSSILKLQSCYNRCLKLFSWLSSQRQSDTGSVGHWFA